MENLPFLLLIALPFVAALPPNLRGVAPQDEKYYEAATIWCKDGSRSFPPERLNDDFCDCIDGTDEPGTSACPNGKFYCKNKGHTPLLIFSSRVNDGICDCCDGNDEYDGKTKCPNTCSEAGKASTEKLQRKIGTFKGGLEVRKRDVENAKHMIQKEKEELSTLKQEEKKLKDVVQKLKAKKELIEKEEQLQQKIEEEKRKAEKEKTIEEAAEIEDVQPSEEMPDTKEISSDVEQNKIHDQEKSDLSETEGTEKLSKEELGRLVASRWTGEDPSMKGRDRVETAMDDIVNAEEDFHEHEDSFNPDQDHGYGEINEGEDEESGLEGRYTSESEVDDTGNAEEDGEDDQDQADGLAMEDEDEYYDNEDSDEQNEPTETTGSAEDQDSEISEKSWLWTKLQEGLRVLSSLYSFSRLPVDKLEADRVRKHYGDATSKLSDIQSKISDLEKKLEQDFGKDGEFYGLYDQCFELQDKKYVYKLCPYRHALQVEGRSTTTLGNWDGFRDDYKVMQFVRGDKCWNGPDRSLKVKLRCGVKTELMDVDEPSRCEYVAVFSTPAVCLEEKLVALQERLKSRGDDSHDEL